MKDLEAGEISLIMLLVQSNHEGPDKRKAGRSEPLIGDYKDRRGWNNSRKDP